MPGNQVCGISWKSRTHGDVVDWLEEADLGRVLLCPMAGSTHGTWWHIIALLRGIMRRNYLYIIRGRIIREKGRTELLQCLVYDIGIPQQLAI